MSPQEHVLERLLRESLEENAAFAPVADLTGAVVRRGRRVRTRRRAGVTVLAAAAVAAGIVLGVTLPSSGPQGNDRIAIQPTTPAPRLVHYPGDGVTVTGPADADKLHGTSQAFRDFVAGHVPEGTSCAGGSGSISVQAWSSAGFAKGAVNDCPGGYVAIWGAPHGTWRQLIGTQAVPSCKALAKWSVPSSIVGDTCEGPSGPQPYHQR